MHNWTKEIRRSLNFSYRQNFCTLHKLPHFIKPPLEEEGIRFLGLEDISVMKLHAIVQSGKRLKDFIDVFYLLEHITMAEMIGYYEEKYT